MTRLPRAGEQSRRGELVDRSRRAVQWLQPGLVVKRWVLTSALGFVLALLGAAIWADLKPIYWTLTTIDDLLRVLAGAGREFTGPLVLLLGLGLVLLGQSRSFGSIQRALAPRKDTALVDALLAVSSSSQWDDYHCTKPERASATRGRKFNLAFADVHVWGQPCSHIASKISCNPQHDCS